MPVVSADWMWPAEWNRVRVAWGVVRDGDRLRLARVSSGTSVEAGVVSLSAWREGEALFDRFHRDREKGAWLVAGLPPHRLLIRRLVSPLQDKRKTVEIWPTLFDAAVPYPIEQCQVAFLPLGSAGEGSACLAAGIRRVDLETVLDEWRDLGLDPDLLIPEPLALCGPGAGRIWMGSERTVWCFWEEGEFRGAGGARTRESREKSLLRQRAALELRSDPVQVGPEGDREEDFLETILARCARNPEPFAVNLRVGEQASDQARSVCERRLRTLRVFGLFTALLILLLPVFLPHLVWMRAEQREDALEKLYTDLVGTPPPPPGLIPVRARQQVEATRSEVRNRLNRLESPVVGSALSKVLQTARSAGVRLESIDLEADRIQARIQGEEPRARAWVEALKAAGWNPAPLEGGGDKWTVQGERP